MSLQPLEFFKIIQNHQLQNGELRIPKVFVKIHWKGISNPLFFILPNGSKHEIFWVKRDGDIWLRKNWEKFPEPLKHGNLLIFKYLGESHFKVKIYSPNTFKIEYFSSTKCTHEKGTVKKSKEVVEVRDDIIENLDDRETDGGGATTSRRTKTGKRKINTAASGGSMVKKVKKNSRNEAVNERARNISHPDENPNFTIKMSRTYLQGDFLIHRFDLIIETQLFPRKFSKKYRNTLGRSRASIRLDDEDDKSWEVKLKFSASGKKFVMGDGWKLFTKQCNLHIDDLCKFELIQPKPVSFKITITRCRNEPHPQQLQDFVSPIMKQNTFRVSLNSLERVSIPNGFLKRHNICHGSMVVFKVGEASWFVKVIYYPNYSYGWFSEGWRKFVRECNLKIGSTCLYEMVDEENHVFKVSIA